MWTVRGHELLVTQLDRSIRAGRFAHSYLLAGPPQVGKRTLAINMAQALNCLSPENAPCQECVQCTRIALGHHADVQVIGLRRGQDGGPSRREIGIGDVREVERQASLTPAEGRMRVFIFDGAEHMSEEASNALLKTLEEPPNQVMIVLLTSWEDSLLPTILSRCRRLELRPMALAEVVKELVDLQGLEEEQAQIIARLSMGRLGWALAAVAEPSILEKRREELERLGQLPAATLQERFSFASDLASLYYRDRYEAEETLQLWLGWWRDLLLIREGAETFIHNLDMADVLRRQAREWTSEQITGFVKAILATAGALDSNANARLALEVLMLALPKEGTGMPSPLVASS